MCGLTGLYSLEPRPDRQRLHATIRAMSDALMHRGPDSGDVWQDPEVSLALGHRRLAIIDLSPLGHQPMESQSGRYIIVFNGEIYNFKSIRGDLEKNHGLRFRGGSDTEVILAAVEQWGFEKTLAALNGMFAIALWDCKAKALYFARDRFGKKPLYVGWAGSTLVFGSELKALMAHPDFRRDVNRRTLTSYMRFGYVPAPMCIFDQVWQIPAGGMLAIDTQLLRGGQDLGQMLGSYWSHKSALEEARKNPIAEGSDFLPEFESLLSQCVADRMISDVPLGAFLSGGIDSSTIVALMQKQSAKPVKTYTIGFNEEGFNEAEYAKKIAAHLGTDHHEMYFSGKDALDLVPELPRIYDEPFADSSSLPTTLVSKFARQSVTVALSGDGGDEMLGGYVRYISGVKGWNIVQNIPPWLRKPFADALSSVSVSTWNKIGRGKPQFGSHIHKFAEILPRRTESDVYLALVSQWLKPKSLVQDGREEIIPLVSPDMQIDNLNFAENMMYWDTISYLCSDILTKVDRASMSVSLESRAPLLDKRIYDFAWRLPIDSKIHNGTGKIPLRNILEKYVPQDLFERPKQGFSIPIGDWLRTDLKDWAEDLLDERILRDQGLLNYPLVRQLWDEHQKGRGNHSARLWTVLMFQDWHRHWVVNG